MDNGQKVMKDRLNSTRNCRNIFVDSMKEALADNNLQLAILFAKDLELALDIVARESIEGSGGVVLDKPPKKSLQKMIDQWIGEGLIS